MGIFKKIDEKSHDDKLLELIGTYIDPKLWEIQILIINLCQFDPTKRFDVDQALNFCVKSKIFGPQGALLIYMFQFFAS